MVTVASIARLKQLRDCSGYDLEREMCRSGKRIKWGEQ
jgi:hypothetical protein